MLDITSARGRIIDGALKLSAMRPWRDVTLHDIAEQAGVTLAGLRSEFSSKAAIVAAFLRAVDDEVLAKAGKPDLMQAPRDRLFEVIMARFDALQPYKAGVASIRHDMAPDFGLARDMLASQRWMLEAAGIGSEGVSGGVRAAGLGSVYVSVFNVWLVDDDPGLARTMAALDRRLRSGESAISTFDEVCKAGDRVKALFTRRADAADRDAGPPPATGSAETPREWRA